MSKIYVLQLNFLKKCGAKREIVPCVYGYQWSALRKEKKQKKKMCSHLDTYIKD